MAEREYLDYDDWLRAGGYEGTGQQLENPDNYANPYLPGEPAPTPRPPATPPVTTTPPPTGGTGKTRAQIEAEGRAHDAANGLVGGYMDGDVWVNGSPSSTRPGDPNPGELGDYTGNGPDYGTMLPFTPRNPYGPFTPRDDTFELEPFGFDPYTASSWEDAEKEPGFDKAQQRLSKMVQNSAAYRGVLRSGQTIGDLDSVLDTNQGQNFAQFDARRFRNYSANRDNAFGAWQANQGQRAQKFGLELGIDRDIYDRGSLENERGNQFKFNTERESFSDSLARWQEQVRSLTSLAQPPS